jgi:hypothetical protein
VNWKAWLARDGEGRLFMKVWDKIDTQDSMRDRRVRFCPPHRVPHVLPVVGHPVVNERCHSHATWWRQHLHHKQFCWLFCPHYEDMREGRRLHFDGKDRT